MNTNITYIITATLITILSLFANNLDTVTTPVKIIISLVGAITWGIVLAREMKATMEADTRIPNRQ